MLRFDDPRRELSQDGEVLVRFGRSRLGYLLLKAIATQPGCTREELYGRVWSLPYRPPSSDNAFHVALNALRKRVPLEIELVGEGYELAGRPPVRATRPPVHEARWHHTSVLRQESVCPPQVEELLAALERHPVLAVCGPGGVGKTELSLHADGMLLDASSIRSVEELDAQLASVLEADTAALGLAARGPELLILDAVEGVEGPLEPFLRGLGCRVLVSSRRRLELPTLEVRPLTVPEAVSLLEGLGVRGELEELALFCACFPLHLRLASRPARLLGARAVLGRADLLRDASRPARQGSPQGVAEWSLSLLGSACREAVDRLSVFVDRFDLEDAEQVAQVDFEVLQTLLDHHLVLETRGRLHLLPLVRRPVSEDMQRRHLEWLAARMTALAAGIRGPHGQEVARAMEARLPDARAAIEAGLDPERTAELAWALDPLLELRGLGRLRQQLAQALVQNEHPLARLFRGREARWRGDLDAAEALFSSLEGGHRALGLASVAVHRGQDPRPWLDEADFPDDPEWQARLRGMRADESERPLVALREAEAMHRLRGDLRGQAFVLGKLAGRLADAGRLDEARVAIERARELSRRLGDETARGVQGGLLGLVHHLAGELSEAEEVYTESLQTLGGRPRNQAIARLNRAFLRIEAGPPPDGEEARSELHLVREARQELAPWAELGLAIIEERQGRPQAARRWRERSGVLPRPGSAEAAMLERLTPSA